MRSNCIIAVCSHGEIGIDIESYDRELSPTKLRDYLLTPSEKRMWEETRGAMRISSFIDYWVAKEAFSKAVGIGHSKAINEIEVELGNDEVKLQACWPGYTAKDWAMRRVDVSPSHSCIISFKKPYA